MFIGSLISSRVFVPFGNGVFNNLCFVTVAVIQKCHWFSYIDLIMAGYLAKLSHSS